MKLKELINFLVDKLDPEMDIKGLEKLDFAAFISVQGVGDNIRIIIRSLKK